MNAHDREIFTKIKEQSEKDKEAWRIYNSDSPSVYVSPEKEDEIMERMFLVYYVKEYLKPLVDKDRI